MPSHSVKQAKVMSAISHGWKPKGSAAKIPVSVAKHFHAADKGHKYGKKRAHGGKVKTAMHIVHKYAKRASGGKVKKYADAGAVEEDDTPVAQPRIDVYRGNPPVSPDEGLSQELMRKTPIENRGPSVPMLTEPHVTPRETITNWLTGPETKSYEPRAILANKAMNILDFTPPMMAEQAGEDIAKGDLQSAALFAMPGAKKAKSSSGFAYALLHAAENPLSEYSASNPVAKKLKEQYGKDLAAASVEYGYTPEQINNIKTYMTPGAQANFDKHYNKMASKAPPAPWTAPEVQTTKPPNLKLVPKEDEFHQWMDEQNAPKSLGIAANDFHSDNKIYDPGETWDHYEKLHDTFSQQPLELSDEEKKAVAYWGQPAGYKDLNGHLRGLHFSELATDYIPLLDEAITHSPLQQPSILWRGIHGPHAEELKKLQPGDSFWNDGYTATTIDPRRATHYGDKESPGIILNYHLPEGYKALYTSHPDAGGWSQAERELLLPHGAPFRIIGKQNIKSPVWDYTGNVKNPNHQNFVVYHVAPADTAEGAHQLDIDPNAKHFNVGPISFKPQGKDTDIEDYYAEMEKHQAGPEWEPGSDEAAALEQPGFHKANSPYKQYLQAKLTPEQYTQALRSHMKPSNWMNYRPVDVRPGEIPQVNWGANDPQALGKIGVNPNVILLKGGTWHSWSEHGHDPFVPGGYPKELMDPSKKHGEPAFHMTTKPGIAEAYHGDKNIGGPYVARPAKFFEFDWPTFFGSYHYSDGDLDKVAREARKMGADIVAVHNMHDVGSHAHGLHTQYLVLNTNVLRAPHAAFDPAKWHLRHPLAGLAGGGIFTYGALGGEPEEKKEGGEVAKKEKDPEDHEFIDFAKGGLINSNIPGRTDKHPMKVRAGSYVLPADIPSALGQNNTMAGAEILKKMFSSGPYGLAPPKGKSSKFHFDHYPNIGLHGGKGARHKAGGGEVEHVPIIAAGGEYVIHPDVVKAIGHGDMTAGHKILDKFVLHTRREHIKTLRKLKPPKA